MAADSTNTTDALASKSESIPANDANGQQSQGDGLPPRDWRFWMIILSISISMFLAALELAAVATALPRIVHELHGEEFVWVGSAYALATTAFLPLSGGLAQIFGRRIVMLGSLLCFAVGSALCGAATSMNFLIAGRTVQGVGGGGITSMTQIILSDLVTLRERGTFNGLIAISWVIASGIGPVVGGSLAEEGHWRWLFYLNIPIVGFAAGLVLLFLRLRTPSGTFVEKIRRIDWIGNFLIIASTTSIVIALTWGGIQFSWSSASILVPLILGLVGLGAFLVYEWKIAKYPMVPFILMSTLTGLSGYLQTFITPIILMGLIYYIPVYFQACKDASPIRSGVDSFGLAFSMAPFSFVTGVLVTKTSRYRPQVWVGWALTMIGTGLLSTLEADTGRGKAIGYQIIAGAGTGVLYMATYFPVLAPVPIKENARALAFFYFFRQFALIWGVTIGGTILQNQLQKNLPADYSANFPQGTEIAYAIIPDIPTLQQPLKDEVRAAFAQALQVVWQTLTGIGGLGFLVSLVLKHLPLHTSVDEDWGMEKRAVLSPSDPELKPELKPEVEVRSSLV